MNQLVKIFVNSCSLVTQPKYMSSYKNTRKMGKYKQTPFKKWNILKGDNIIVNSGRDEGKTGKVLKVYRRQNKILVQDINLKMKRVKGTDEQEGGIKQIMHPIHISNAQLIDPETGRGTRVRRGFLATGQKVRVAKKSGAIIDKPIQPTYVDRHKEQVDGVKDTHVQQVLKVTYQGEDFAKIKREFQEFIQEKERREKLLIFDN